MQTLFAYQPRSLFKWLPNFYVHNWTGKKLQLGNKQTRMKLTMETFQKEPK